MPLRVTGAQQGVDAVAETPVYANGQTFRLGDVATVTHGYEDPPSWLIRSQGQPALEVGVVMARRAAIFSRSARRSTRRSPISSPSCRAA